MANSGTTDCRHWLRMELVSAIEQAAAQTAATTLQLPIASIPVRLRFATSGLASMFAPSFVVDGTEAANDGQAGWDVFVTAGDQGTPPPSLVPNLINREMLLSDVGSYYALWAGQHAPALYAVDIERRRALYWIAKADDIPVSERTRPFLAIVQVILNSTPWMMVHAAAIAWRGRAALLTGPGRAGKTSLALAGLGAGWRYAGDDYVLVRTSGTPEVAPIYSTARLRDDMVRHFPALESARFGISEDDGDRRHELSLGLLPEGTREFGGAPLSAVLLLRRNGAATPRFEPISRTALLAALAAHTATSMPGQFQQRTAKLLQFLAAVEPRCFDPGSTFGPALDALAEALA